jgi:hypothetical protein
MIDGIPQWVPDGPDGATDPVNIFDLYPMPGTPEIDASELTESLSTLEREEYGDRLIDDFASTGAPDICIDGINVPEAFQDGLAHLSGDTGLPGVIYGDTIDGVLAQYTDQPFNAGSIHGWVRNVNQLQLHYPGLSDAQVDVMGIAIGHLPSYNGQRMHIAIPAGASDEQIVDELMMSLGSLLTNEDLAAFLANLPQQRDEPLLVDIYELYQEILARYQTRLHSDERVWEAEIAVNQRQAELDAFGEGFYCETEVPPPECDELHRLRAELADAQVTYIDAIVEVNNEMIDAGMMTLMDADVSRRTQSLAARLFAATTVATISTLVPLTLEDAAIDAATYGLGRIRRIGPALERALDRVRGGGRVSLDWVRDISDRAVQRIRDFRRGRVLNREPIIDVSNQFEVTPRRNGGYDINYLDPDYSEAVDSSHGIRAFVNEEGVLGFDIFANPDLRATHGSGQDMFNSMMKRLSQEGIEVNKINGNWLSGRDSVNYDQYMEGLSQGLTPEQSALNTWTGTRAQEFGYSVVESIEGTNHISVIFRKP